MSGGDALVTVAMAGFFLLGNQRQPSQDAVVKRKQLSNLRPSRLEGGRQFILGLAL